MGYRIEYGQTVKKESINTVQISKNTKAATYTILLITAVIVFLFIVGSDSVRSFLLPGDPPVTEQALNTFAEQVEAGESFGEAAAAFCREIIAGADIS